jgi:lipoate-protein ligase A
VNLSSSSDLNQDFPSPDDYPGFAPPEAWSRVRIVKLPPVNIAQALAFGEAALRRAREPALIFAPEIISPSLSIGHAQKASEVPEGIRFSRRLTGGGMIECAGTLSLASVVPKKHLMWGTAREKMYTDFNQAVSLALADHGLPNQIAADAPEFEPPMEATFGACFDGIYRFDVADPKGKLAASNVFRTPDRQIRICHIQPREAVVEQLVESLIKYLTPLHARCAETDQPTEWEDQLARECLINRYDNDQWNYRI